MGETISSCGHCGKIWDMNIQQLPQLALRVYSSPFAGSESSSGVRPSPFLEGEEVAVRSLEKVPGWEALNMRFQQSARLPRTKSMQQGPSWPSGYRFDAPRRYWRAKLVTSDGNGGFQELTCLLQVATNGICRTQRHIDEDLDDWQSVAAYAHRFNTHLLRKTKIDVGATRDAAKEMPGVQVSPPAGCQVLGSSLPQFIAAGDAVLIAPFDPLEVQKFVFDGSEDYHELPQAFFHYAAWSSGGHEMVCDIQGAPTDDGGYLIVDPCVLRKSPPTVADVLGSVARPLAALASKNAQKDGIEGRFNFLHPKCAQMCKTFDPQRQGGHARTHCGICVTCGA